MLYGVIAVLVPGGYGKSPLDRLGITEHKLPSAL